MSIRREFTLNPFMRSSGVGSTTSGSAVCSSTSNGVCDEGGDCGGGGSGDPALLLDGSTTMLGDVKVGGNNILGVNSENFDLITPPTAPPVGGLKLYANTTDGKLHYVNSNGDDIIIEDGAGPPSLLLDGSTTMSGDVKIGGNDVLNLKNNVFTMDTSGKTPLSGELTLYANTTDGKLHYVSSDGTDLPIDSGATNPFNQSLNTTDNVKFSTTSLRRTSITPSDGSSYYKLVVDNDKNYLNVVNNEGQYIRLDNGVEFLGTQLNPDIYARNGDIYNVNNLDATKITGEELKINQVYNGNQFVSNFYLFERCQGASFQGNPTAIGTTFDNIEKKIVMSGGVASLIYDLPNYSADFTMDIFGNWIDEPYGNGDATLKFGFGGFSVLYRQTYNQTEDTYIYTLQVLDVNDTVKGTSNLTTPLGYLQVRFLGDGQPYVAYITDNKGGTAIMTTQFTNTAPPLSNTFSLQLEADGDVKYSISRLEVYKANPFTETNVSVAKNVSVSVNDIEQNRTCSLNMNGNMEIRTNKSLEYNNYFWPWNSSQDTYTYKFDDDNTNTAPSNGFISLNGVQPQVSNRIYISSISARNLPIGGLTSRLREGTIINLLDVEQNGYKFICRGNPTTEIGGQHTIRVEFLYSPHPASAGFADRENITFSITEPPEETGNLVSYYTCFSPTNGIGMGQTTGLISLQGGSGGFVFNEIGLTTATYTSQNANSVSFSNFIPGDYAYSIQTPLVHTDAATFREGQVKILLNNVLQTNYNQFIRFQGVQNTQTTLPYSYLVQTTGIIQIPANNTVFKAEVQDRQNLNDGGFGVGLGQGGENPPSKITFSYLGQSGSTFANNYQVSNDLITNYQSQITSLANTQTNFGAVETGLNTLLSDFNTFKQNDLIAELIDNVNDLQSFAAINTNINLLTQQITSLQNTVNTLTNP